MKYAKISYVQDVDHRNMATTQHLVSDLQGQIREHEAKLRQIDHMKARRKLVLHIMFLSMGGSITVLGAMSGGGFIIWSLILAVFPSIALEVTDHHLDGR